MITTTKRVSFCLTKETEMKLEKLRMICEENNSQLIKKSINFYYDFLAKAIEETASGNQNDLFRQLNTHFSLADLSNILSVQAIDLKK